ncbi:DUF4466 family protein [Sphingobacterium sp. JB170]|uniref:DUF4466 family protein n=1 Tax=Sphingobacterium sp. JB170 TaxID=1434842 RepID=UPI00097EBD53|nr:DUF4466 family protein [Sphingobacterium sp. JB170]SJN46661.1 hypothetical protein FM107_14715 [Sphingobacterium sp. JB170]
MTMKNMSYTFFRHIAILMFSAIFFSSCSEKEYSIPEGGADLQNDVIKRSLGPNLVGLDIEFAYAMALPKQKGKILWAQVEASIAGGEETYLENKSYYTHSGSDEINGGTDVGVVIGKPSENQGAKTIVNFSRDTSAATLRYFYDVPEQARGKKVEFTFTAKSSDGSTVSYKMGPYQIAVMDMVLNLEASDNQACYLSIKDMTFYSAAQAATRPQEIDLVYLYRGELNSFGHALVSPGADRQYLPQVDLPTGLSRSTKMRREFGLRDQQLGNPKYGIYIDDVDFQQLDVSDSPNYALNLKEEAGAWLETQDGTYRAYVFVNKIDNAGAKATLSMKRYKLK